MMCDDTHKTGQRVLLYFSHFISFTNYATICEICEINRKLLLLIAANLHNFFWMSENELISNIFIVKNKPQEALKMLGLQIFQCEKNPAEFYCLNHLVSCGCDGFLQHNHNFHTTWSIVVFNSANKKSLNFILFIKDFCI